MPGIWPFLQPLSKSVRCTYYLKKKTYPEKFPCECWSKIHILFQSIGTCYMLHVCYNRHIWSSPQMTMCVFCVLREQAIASGTKRRRIPHPHKIFRLTKKTPLFLMAGSKPITACLKCYQWEKFFRDSKKSEPWWYSSPLLLFSQNPRQNTQ